MERITLDLFTSFRYLSDLQADSGSETLFFVETQCSMADNGYVQHLHSLDPVTKKTRVLTAGMPRLSYTVNERGLFTFEKNDTGTAVQNRDKDTGTVKSSFSVPLNIIEMKPFGENTWAVLAMTNTACGDWHLMSEGEREAFLKQKEEDSDYLVADEYPFVFNARGFINGSRNRLFICRKDSLPEALGSTFLDVSSWDISGSRIVFSGMEYQNCQHFTSKVFEYNDETKQLDVLYDKDDMMFRKVFYRQGDVIVLAARDNMTGENPKVYVLKDGALSLLADPDTGFHSSLGSDSRYGKLSNAVRDGDDWLFVTSDVDEASLFRLSGNTLTKEYSCGGSVDTAAVGKEAIYMILMKDQALQEIYSLKDGKAEKLTCINEAVLKDRYTAVPRPLIVEKETPIHGWVLEPFDYDPAKKYPAILDIHGGPRTIYGTVYYHEMQYWANKGYFVFFCNPRGSDGRGNDFADLRPAWGDKDYEDIMDFTDLVLKTYPAIDPARLGVTGGSYGGYMTNWIITHTDRFKAAATQRSISNWISELYVSDISAGYIRSLGMADINDAFDVLWDMSPLKYVSAAVTPTLFIHSTEDYRCPVPEGVQLFTALKLKGVDSRLVMFKGENHELSRTGKPKHRIRRLKEITDWMDHYLLQEDVPA